LLKISVTFLVTALSTIGNTSASSTVNNGFNSDNKNFVRYIAWTNDSVKGYNQFIRKDFLKADKPLIVNESLLSYSSMPTENGLDYTIVNSEDYFVNSIEEFNDTLGIKVWRTKLTETDSDRNTIVKIVVPEEENYKLYLAQRENLLNTAKLKKGKAWRAFYGFRDSYCLLHDLFLSGQKADKKNIDYGYGITIHKSQGSTFDNVIINGKDINKNPNEFERKRLWYVALSRASKKAYIIL